LYERKRGYEPNRLNRPATRIGAAKPCQQHIFVSKRYTGV
jgi:hypothetical protein